MRVDGAAVERLLDVDQRPLVSVFLPDRLGADQGRAGAAPRAPGPVRRRAVAGAARHAPAYAQALAQRNALIARIRAGRGSRESLATLGRAARRARHRADGATAAARSSCSPSRSRGCGARSDSTATPSSLPAALARHRAGGAGRRSWPSGSTATSSAASPATGRTATTSPPTRDGRDLRAYGSQGQQRLALLALLLAEREAIARQPRRLAADAARRRDERARPRPPPGAGRAASRDRRPVGDHRDRPRARARRRPTTTSRSLAVVGRPRCWRWRGRMTPYRRSPRPLALALDPLRDELAPADAAGGRAARLAARGR